MAKPSMGIVQVYVRARGGEPLPSVKATTVVQRPNKLRRVALEFPSKPAFVKKLKMTVGPHPIFVGAPGYYDVVETMKFTSSSTMPKLTIQLDPQHAATFKKVVDLVLNQVRFYVNKGEKPVVQVVRQESRTPTERLFR